MDKKELKQIVIEGVPFEYDEEKYYEKEGHVYCKSCHERIDGDVMNFLNRKMIFRISCQCDRDREEEERLRMREMEIDRLKTDCFSSGLPWLNTFQNFKGEKTRAYQIAENYVKNYEKMRADNVGLLFYGSVGSGKTYLSCAIANAIMETYLQPVLIRNFSEIINTMQSCRLEDKNNYIHSIVSVPLLILDDLGIERDTSYAREQVYHIINNRYLMRKPTIFTTNLPYDTILNCSDNMEYQRIYSRIVEMTIPVMVVGNDFRKAIQKEKMAMAKEVLLKGVN